MVGAQGSHGKRLNVGMLYTFGSTIPCTTMLSGSAGAGPNAVLAITSHHMCSFHLIPSHSKVIAFGSSYIVLRVEDG